MLQLVYISTASAPIGAVERDTILQTSRRNNGRDAITGLLYTDGKRFLQALEGPAAIVETAFARIQADPRHRAIVVLSRREVATREFGEWAMASRTPGADSASFLQRIALLTQSADANVRATFQSFAEMRRAA
jgi:hypothetical protein